MLAPSVSMRALLTTCLLLAARALPRGAALDIDTTSKSSLLNAAFTFSHGMMTYYNGNISGETPGMFVSPYYWWEAGAAWDTLLSYWFITGDTTYNDQVKSSLLYQVGSDDNYQPANQTTSEGNDDQEFWAFAVMTAAERNFTNPDSSDPQWLELAVTVYDELAGRWDTASCGGGLRWQIFEYNNGYDYKNTISNAGFFLLGSRLARYSSNDTYVEWAERTWDWMEEVGLLNTDYYYFYDGADVSENCTDIKAYQWSYNAACFLAGSAYLYNYTESEVWYNRTQNILDGLHVFFNSTSGIMYEVACENALSCDTDQKSFKAYLARYMGLTAVLAPFTYDTIMEHLTKTAAGLATSCTGGTDGVTCGMNWMVGYWDGEWGLGEEMGALEVVQNLMIGDVPAPYTATTGGSSTNGSDSSSDDDDSDDGVITTGDRAGAGIVTSVALILMLLFSGWMVV
ncbi:glycosyl hydrolase family 76-domain-containing protein [Limtongia smithiae]|uniref:glycosyl hydrolase family 76-domain-containing protein n=1 Tax=Limtongia smithiae TaxID=1125753 RepID=UPI0034CE0572